MELEKMTLFCIECVKGLKGIHMNNFWLKKCEKSVTGIRKGKAIETSFPS